MDSDATAQIAPCQAKIDQPDNTDPRPDNLIQLRQKDIPTWRAKLLAQQDNTCLVCQTKISKTDKSALDHQHGKKGVEIGHQKSGLVRGVLHDQCNRFEGVLVCCILYIVYSAAFLHSYNSLCLLVCLFNCFAWQARCVQPTEGSATLPTCQACCATWPTTTSDLPRR